MTEEKKTSATDEWVAWWNSLTAEQKRAVREHSKRHQKFWRRERLKVLFGLFDPKDE